MIEAEPSFGYRTVASLLQFNKNTVQRSAAVCRHDAERTLGNGSVSRLGGP
jgi:hypothetical protein